MYRIRVLSNWPNLMDDPACPLRYLDVQQIGIGEIVAALGRKYRGTSEEFSRVLGASTVVVLLALIVILPTPPHDCCVVAPYQPLLVGRRKVPPSTSSTWTSTSGSGGREATTRAATQLTSRLRAPRCSPCAHRRRRWSQPRVQHSLRGLRSRRMRVGSHHAAGRGQ